MSFQSLVSTDASSEVRQCSLISCWSTSRRASLSKRSPHTFTSARCSAAASTPEEAPSGRVSSLVPLPHDHHVLVTEGHHVLKIRVCGHSVDGGTLHGTNTLPDWTGPLQNLKTGSRTMRKMSRWSGSFTLIYLRNSASEPEPPV